MTACEWETTGLQHEPVHTTNERQRQDRFHVCQFLSLCPDLLLLVGASSVEVKQRRMVEPLWP